MKNTTKITKWITIPTLFSILVLMVMMTWYFSSKSGIESNQESKVIAKYLENIAAENFVINRNDTFWRVSINLILRKVAHFLEYMAIGIVACTLLNLLTRRVWLAAVVSIVTCPILAYIDEYRQIFIDGRTPRWFDVKVDSAGAFLGIFITTLVFAVLTYIWKLKLRISVLEEKGTDSITSDLKLEY